MELTPETSSSAIKAHGHDPDTNTLHVEFTSGVYTYPGFSVDDYETFKNAPSRGKHFAQYIRQYYAGTKL